MAIRFTGGENRLELHSGYTIQGGVTVESSNGASGTLALGGAVDGSFDASDIGTKYSHFTAFEKIGTATWTLTDTGANSRAIRFNVKQGRLAVDGNLSSNAVKVETNGILGGVGTVGVTAVVGGTLAPGNSIGTLKVNGNLSFDSASTYAVEVSPTASDRVDVSGTAFLGEAKVATSFQPGSYVAKQYTILTAAGVTGSFGPKVDSNLPAGFKSTLRYDPRTVFLDLALDYTPPETEPQPESKPQPETKPDTATKPESKPGAGAASSPAATPAATPPNRGLNPNQSRAANALTGYFNRTGGIPMAFGALTAQGLSQVAGEPVTAMQTNATAAITQFMGALVDGVPGERGVALAAGPAGFAAYSSARSKAAELPARQAALTPDPDLWRWSLWGSGFGGVQFNGASAIAGTAAATNRIYGAAVGADYRLSSETTLGFALGGGATLFNSYGLGSGSSDLFQAGLFLRRQFGASNLSASAAYAWQDVTTDRVIGTSEHLQGRFDANSYAGRLEAGHRLSLAGFGVTPYAAARYSLLSLPGYRETALSGPGLFALAYAGKDTTRLRSELGLRLDRQIDLGGFDLTLRAAAAWVATSNTRASASASFQTLPGASFLVQGAAPDRNALRTSAAAELKLSQAMTLSASFEGEFAKNSRSLGGKAALRYSW
ncbi:MAG: autotransporter outer membrane beta-barrel domain-containing protein [Bosea sp. (in: a-proteobacteria)]